MKVILVMVVSVNGKTTRGDESSIYQWTSREDQEFFFSFIKKSNLIIMGSKTYEAARSIIKLDSKILRIVMTRAPRKYDTERVAGQLEFTNLSPLQLFKQLKRRGYKQMLLAGGAKINSLFLKNKLVDDIYLTVEPRIFGKGKPLVGSDSFDITLKLVSSKKLNSQGTLLLHYKVLR